MPITSSAKKALRVSGRKRVFNQRRKRAMQGALKVAIGKASKENLAAAYKAIDKAAKRGILKKNAAARKKSQVAKALAKVGK